MRDLILCLQVEPERSRAFIFDRKLQLLVRTARPLELNTAVEGRREQDPEELWNATLSAAQEAVNRVGVDRIAGLGLTFARDAVVVWERNGGRPIHPALLPGDVRAQALCERLRQEHKEPMLHYRTGLFLSPDFPAAKIAWILQQVPGARERALNGELACGALDAWMIWNLSRGGSHATDMGTASTMLLFDLSTRLWEAQLLAAFGVPAALLPGIVPTSGPIGETAPEWFGRPIPILASAGEQAAGLFAFAHLGPGEMKISFGDQVVLLASAGAELKIPFNLTTVVAWTLGHRTEYALEAHLPVGRGITRWIQRQWGIDDRPEENSRLALALPDTDGVYFVPALNGLGLPYFDPTARGTLLGLTSRTHRGHILRAALEGVAHHAADAAAVFTQTLKRPLERVCVDGEDAADDFLMQFQADLLGVPVFRPYSLETAARGIAHLAGLAAGWYTGHGDIQPAGLDGRLFEPIISKTERLQRRRRWQNAVERALNWELFPRASPSSPTE